MRIALVTAVWQRPALTEYVLKHYGWLKAKLHAEASRELSLICVGSREDESWNPGAFQDWQYVVAPNEPLSKKWQAGLARARELEPDFVCIVGSDDLFTADYFERMPDYCPKNGAVGFGNFWFLNLPAKMLGFFPGYERKEKGRRGVFRPDSLTVGAGRMFGSELLDKLDWVLWPEPVNDHLDTACSKALMGRTGLAVSPASLQEVGCFGMDVKSATGMWGWRQYKYSDVLRGDAVDVVLQSVGLGGVLGVKA